MMLWADGFDHYGDDESQMLDGPYASVNSTLSTTRARTGTRSLLVGSINGNGFRRVFGAAKTTVGVGMAMFHASIPDSNDMRALFEFNDGANNSQVTIWLQSTGAIEAKSGGSPQVSLGLSTTLMTAGAWNHLEAKVVIDDTDGAVEVRLNGVTILNATNKNTDRRGTGEVSQVFSGSHQSHFIDVYADDLFAWDDAGAQNNDFVGDRKVFTDVPTADTAEVDWAPSSGGTRFAMIDEIPPDDDATYDTTTDTGDRMGVTFGDLPAEVVSVAAVILVHKSRKTDAGDCNVTVHADSGGDEADGTDRPMTTEYTFYHDVFELDPHTAAPFTNAAASAVAMVVERTA